MNQIQVKALVLAALCCGGVAGAQEIESSEPTIRSGQGWSLSSGRTVGANANAFQVEMGWPGVCASFFHGVSGQLDLGGRLGFNYGFEGVIDTVVPGLKLQGLLRAQVYESGKLTLGLEFAPGPFFYFFTPRFGPTVTQVGLVVPVGLVLGITASSALNVSFGLELPMYVLFGNYQSFNLPILVGAGAEYFIDQNLLVSFNTRMGPTLTGGRVPFTLEALVGVGYRL